MSNRKGLLPDLLGSLLSKIPEISNSAASTVLKKFSRLSGKHICLGITGLSQSGKSAFITSLINQLLHHDRAQLPGFAPVLSNRLLGVTVLPLDDEEIASFPYDSSYRGMTGKQPKWPLSTKGVSGSLLELRVANSGSSLNPFASESSSFYLEIRDYPGEWLLDLPMREMSYRCWSAQCAALYELSPRKELLGELLLELQQIDPLSKVDEGRLKSLNQRFVSFLHACKENRLSLIQPGRFLLPDKVDDPTTLCFIPLLNIAHFSEKQLESAAANSLYKVCMVRYRAYIKTLVEPFYKDFFSRIDRQLVLVDVVNTLSDGPEYMTDMCNALTHITDSLSYGAQGHLRQFFTPKISKVVFAGTKIDQVLSEDHERTRQLLGSVVRQAYLNAQLEGVRPGCEVTAAVRCSKEQLHQGEMGITGISQSGKPIGYQHPTIPPRIPEGEEWQPFLEWSPPMLMPPNGLSYKNGDPIPHIRIDTILEALLGDLLP
jgi:hypothetical protein